jgi:hypothetical protein
VFCHPWGVGALPPLPMATLDAEDDVHITPKFHLHVWVVPF